MVIVQGGLRSAEAPHPIFEHVFIRFNNGDLDDLRSPRGMSPTFFVSQESVFSVDNPDRILKSER